MVADDYFNLRSRLGAALFSLSGVADRSGLEPSLEPVVKSLVEGLRDPFLFVVAGEVNAGKSTLLNALFGDEFCLSGVLPETRSIHYFRYGKVPLRTTVSDLLEEVELPHPFLRDFHVVDTPGINSTEPGHDRITGDFIPRADVVLYCFPATNPWSGAAWEFLGRIHDDWLKKVVLVLQQADLRTPEEVEAISEHMRAIARQRLGRELPVFPVSARLALLARTSGVDKVRLLASSAFPALEHQLTALVASTAPRMGKLITACAAGQAMLAEVQTRLAAAAARLTGLIHLQESALETVRTARNQSDQEASAMARRLRHAWDSLTPPAVAASLAERAGFPALLWKRDATAETVESRLLPPLMTAVREAAAHFDGALGNALAVLWKHPGSAIHRAVAGHVRRPPEPVWPSRGTVFTTTMENAACEAVTQSGLAACWTDRLDGRRRMLRGLSVVGLLVLAGVTAAAVSGNLSLAAIGWVAGLCIAGTVAGRTILKREAAESAAMATALLAEAGGQLQREAEAIARAHGQRQLDDFAPVLEPLDLAIRLKQHRAAPLEEETGELALTLQALSRALRTGAA